MVWWWGASPLHHCEVLGAITTSCMRPFAPGTNKNETTALGIADIYSIEGRRKSYPKDPGGNENRPSSP